MIIKLKTECKKNNICKHIGLCLFFKKFFFIQINFMIIIIIIIIIIKCSVSLCIFVIKCQFPPNLL